MELQILTKYIAYLRSTRRGRNQQYNKYESFVTIKE